jgi:hypothetical protein
MSMADYGNKEARLREGRKLYNVFKRSDQCPNDVTEAATLQLEIQSYEKRKKNLKVKDVHARSQFQLRFNSEWKRLNLPKNSKLATVTKFCNSSTLWKEMANATITREELVQMISSTKK